MTIAAMAVVGLAVAVIAAVLVASSARGSEVTSAPPEIVVDDAFVADAIGAGTDDDERNEREQDDRDDEPTPSATPTSSVSDEADPEPSATPRPTAESKPEDRPEPEPTAVADDGVVSDEAPDGAETGADSGGGVADPGPAEPVASDDDEEDFPEGEPLPSSDPLYPLPPALPAGFEPELPAEPEVPAVPEAPAPPAPEPATLVVLPVELPTPVPLPTPEPVVLGPIEGGATDLSSNAFGCESRCITSATLGTHLRDADVDFVVSTNVDTKNALWIIPAGPAVVNGLPAHLAHTPRAVNQDRNRSWSGTVTGLAFDTTYRVVVSALDNQGNTQLYTGMLTTIPEPADELVADGSPCVFECIQEAVVTPGPTFDRAQIRVETTDTATINIAISQSAPGTIDGHPFLPNDVVITGLTKDGGTYNANVFDLEPDTTYHVVVKAIDDAGVRQYASGSFRSLPAPPPPPPPPPQEYAVVMWVDRFHIHQDGDRVGRGEISFDYGIQYANEPLWENRWSLPFQKLGEGETISAGGYRSVHVTENQALPHVIVNARESDRTGNDCLVEVGEPLLWESTDHMCPNETLTVAALQGVTVDWIRNLPSCDSWNVPGGNPGDRCFTLRSFGVHDDDYVDFGALIVFRVFEA